MNRARILAIIAVMFGLVFIFGRADSQIKIGDFEIDVDKAVEAGKEFAEAARPMKYEEEHKLGRMLAARLAGNFGVWKDAYWTTYINLVGRSLVPYSSRPDIKYRFAVLDTDAVNAYSAPAGYIFISRGLLKELESEAQLAGVLGHEIAHVSRKHVVKEVQKSHLYSGTAIVALEAADVDDSQQEAIEMLVDAGWDKLVTKGLSKEDEYEADQFGTKNAARFGYDPYGLYHFIERLKEVENKPGEKMKIFLSTHPKPSKRIKKLDKYFKDQGLKKISGKGFEDNYQSFRSRHPIP
jgi:predicted Zn-dependent protease